MATIDRTRLVGEEELDQLRTERRDLLVEAADGPDSWISTDGPFKAYRRRLTVEPVVTAGNGSSPQYRVNERTEYKLDLPLWWPYLWPLMRYGLAQTDRTPRRRFWWPKDVVSTETTRMIAFLGTIGTMAGYMGVLIGQTITFASEDFGVADDVQANTLALVRVGVLLPAGVLWWADRRGRRPLILAFTFAAIVFTALGAIAPSMFALGASQAVARGLTTGLFTLITLASTEQVPAGARALSISFMTLTAGFGAALVIWVLPIADRFDGAWRTVYLVPLLFIPLLWWISRNLPETRRFTMADSHRSPGVINWYRFALIGGAAFVGALFLSPASQLRNEFLRDEQGFSATDISLFQLSVSIPATVAIPVAGVLADRFGRRWLGAIAMGGSAVMSALSYQSDGWRLWVAACLSVTLASAAVPALRGYQTELFPTRARGRVGGLIDLLVVLGSVIGFVVVGQLSVRWGDLGDAISSMAWAPLLVAGLVLLAFPETANRELEEFNPGDPTLGDRSRQLKDP